MNPAFTYSQLDTFTNCPRKFYHTKVIKDVVEPPTIHTEWGSKVHAALESCVRDGTPMPEGMEKWERMARKIRASKGEKLIEYKFSLDKNMQPCDWSAAWTRGILDIGTVHEDKAWLGDWKTGKRKPTDQLALYAAYVFSYYPQVTSVKTSFIWLKEGKMDTESFTRSDVPEIWNRLMPRITRLERAYEKQDWPPKPSGLCPWCPVGKAHCEFWKPRK